MFNFIRHSMRFAHVGYVLAREGVISRIDPAIAPPQAKPLLWLAGLIARKTSADAAGRLARALGRLGPSHVKFGQFLSTRPDVVGAKLAKDLERLQDRMPAFPQAEAIKLVEATLEAPLAKNFSHFSEAVAAASIAQVHKATRADTGETVAVKILRPGVRNKFRKDLDAFRGGAEFAEKYLPGMERLKPTAIVEVLERSVAMELDLRLEAAALSEMAQNTKDDPGFRLPTPDWERTGHNVLTMSWIDGIPLSDITALEEARLDLPALGRTVIESFLRHAIRDGFFHADMHQGNLFADRGGNLVAVDFGIMGRIGDKERRFLAEILFGFITRNYRRVAEVHFEAGYVPAKHSIDDFAQAIRAIGEPIHQRRADEISMAKLLTLLFEITDLFDMKTRPELVMLQKTMVVVEGVGRTLDPKLDMWKTAEPVVRGWIERHLGPIGKLQDAGEGVGSIARAAFKMPELVNRSERLVGELEGAVASGFTLSSASIESIGKAEARRARWGNGALWVIAGLLAVLAWRMV
ncbi:MAG: 2-polyprenylphenol 6-hydroxylase [Beijerinckiaceae bacterium]